MVTAINSFLNLFLVLFSKKNKCWKLADFGSASAATSKKLVTTAHARGTDGYRAPEVIIHERYSRRSDMFALGCITYEIVTGRKLFSSDWAMQEYVRNGHPLYPTRWPPCGPGTRLLQLGQLTSTLVTVDHISRPSAKVTTRKLGAIRNGEPHLEEPDSDDNDESDIEGHLSTSVIFRPVLQPSLRLNGTPKTRQMDTDFERSWSTKGALSFDYFGRRILICNGCVFSNSQVPT
jgi:serine/threonine protein kinase